MKFIALFSAALAAGIISAQATSQNTAPAVPVTTNANPEAAMTALFGDPAIVKGDGFDIKRSEYDQLEG